MKATAWELEDSTSVIMHTDDSVLIIQGGGEVVLNKGQLEQILALFSVEPSTTQKRVKKSLKDLKVDDALVCVDNSRFPNLFTNGSRYRVVKTSEDRILTTDDISTVMWWFDENGDFQEMFDVLI